MRGHPSQPSCRCRFSSDCWICPLKWPTSGTRWRAWQRRSSGCESSNRSGTCTTGHDSCTMAPDTIYLGSWSVRFSVAGVAETILPLHLPCMAQVSRAPWVPLKLNRRPRVFDNGSVPLYQRIDAFAFATSSTVIASSFSVERRLFARFAGDVALGAYASAWSC